ncbi:hypothetical protein HF086_005135 [Spodoptera exigua]|uniref:Dynein axonemal assembly factor 1 homolog n=1 Tax=Spodoptera exigua TaxID=7107 RepID=A0A922SLL6_SPOEX|nr:hypothetical protein HF086_005135 [Spodoptera exigua]
MDQDSMPPKRSLNSLIIHPDVEPGVIDNAMLTRCILENGPTEEAGRLFAEEGVHLDEAEEVRLEFQKILRIDHLWMLKSLRKLTLAHNLIEKIENLDQLTGLNELDLSFNKINKIEKLDALVNLEVLTLFHNKIRKLENLDTLENLLVFSIGDNKIEDYKEMAYLRRFRKLRSVSFKGNPCCDDPMSYQFIRAALPRVTYVDYKIVTEEERESGRSMFRGLIRKMDEADEKTEQERIAKEEYDAKVTFYAMSFVEYLSGPELLETMFEKDSDGQTLLSFGGELQSYFDQYKENYVETMANLVEFAQEAYNDRQNEIKLFKDLVDSALSETVEKSKKVLEEFQGKKKPIMAQVADISNQFKAKQISLEQMEPMLLDLGETYHEMLYELWKSLMTIEMQLFEQCEDSRVQFSVNMAEKVTKLLEVSRMAFGAWREHEGVWSTRQFEVLSKYLGNKVMLGDASPELFDVSHSTLVLKDFINIIFSKILTPDANQAKVSIVVFFHSNEVKRNRDRILEINYFIDNQREEWADMHMALTDTVDPDAVALLGDDF